MEKTKVMVQKHQTVFNNDPSITKETKVNQNLEEGSATREHDEDEEERDDHHCPPNPAEQSVQPDNTGEDDNRKVKMTQVQDIAAYAIFEPRGGLQEKQEQKILRRTQ